jgi:hypothetical protein
MCASVHKAGALRKGATGKRARAARDSMSKSQGGSEDEKKDEDESESESEYESGGKSKRKSKSENKSKRRASRPRPRSHRSARARASGDTVSSGGNSGGGSIGGGATLERRRGSSGATRRRAVEADMSGDQSSGGSTAAGDHKSSTSAADTEDSDVGPERPAAVGNSPLSASERRDNANADAACLLQPSWPGSETVEQILSHRRRRADGSLEYLPGQVAGLLAPTLPLGHRHAAAGRPGLGTAPRALLA